MWLVMAAGTRGVSEEHCCWLVLASASLPQTQRHCGCVSCCSAAQRWVSMVTLRLVPRLQVFQKRKFSFPSKEPFCQETQHHLPQPALRLPANEPSLGNRVPAACPPGSYFHWQSAPVLQWMSSPLACPERALCCRIELTHCGTGFIASPSLSPWSKRCFPQHLPLLAPRSLPMCPSLAGPGWDDGAAHSCLTATAGGIIWLLASLPVHLRRRPSAPGSCVKSGRDMTIFLPADTIHSRTIVIAQLIPTFNRILQAE